ncbi:MAG: hypothetical protein IJ428_03235 [Clostridia bacterium]|nr:hypothetical protein [Clostridia bacterium]
MKKRILAALAASILLAAAVTSCSSSKLIKLTSESGNLIDKANDITYINAPMCFEPISTEIDPYAECSELKLQLYGIVGCDTSVWLSEKFEGIGSIYYAEGAVELPTLSEFEANEIIICIEQTITTGLGVVTDAADIEAIIAAFENGERTTIIPEGDVYKLKFSSDKYEGIYYNLVYIEADGGENYIYDRSTKTCSAVGDVMYDYLPR